MATLRSKARLWCDIRKARHNLGYDPDETFTITKHYGHSLLGNGLPGRRLKIAGLTDTSSTTIRVDPKNYRLACNEDRLKLKARVGKDGRIEFYTKYYPLVASRYILVDVLNSLI